MNRRETLLGAAALAACGPAGGTPVPAAPPFPMRRGVNLGNALEAPNEGDWGYRIEADHLSAIADAGFDGVRLPVRWDAHAGTEAPFAIAPAFFNRVDEIVQQALARGLKVQADLHHYDSLVALTQAHSRRFNAIWRQIAERYHDVSPDLMFEPLNEPHGGPWTGAFLQGFQASVVANIRRSNPDRQIILGPSEWQNIDALGDWRPPANAAAIAVSVHYYEPHAFTHQGAEWLGAEAPRFDRQWGTRADRARVVRDIEAAARWGRQYGHSMQLGEFGVNGAVPIQQRASWTRAVREACEANGMGWCVWDFAGAFPIWDRETRAFLPLTRDALFA